MVEIKYRDQFEVSELAGQTIAEAREQFKAEFGIPNKAQAKLNGVKVKAKSENDTVLNDDDKLTFAVSHGRGAFLVGALLLALAITGGVFASGFINATISLTSSTGGNFANVAPATGVGVMTGWSSFGFFKGSISGGNIFTVTPDALYTGDLVVTVTIGNGGALAKVYRVLAMTLEIVDDSVVPVALDITGNAGGAGHQEWTMLTLDNGSASMFVTSDGGVMTVRVKSGFYVTHIAPYGVGSSASPDLFCEVAQR